MEAALRELAALRQNKVDPRRFTDAQRAAEDLATAALEAASAKELGAWQRVVSLVCLFMPSCR
jgi:hypothetical protein